MIMLKLVPTRPLRGTMAEMAGVSGGATTVNPSGSLTVSLVVVWVATVTLRNPSSAFNEMLSCATNCVLLETVTDLTVMPLPRLTVVFFWTKCVFWPVMVTLSAAPGWPVLGTMEVIFGV